MFGLLRKLMMVLVLALIIIQFFRPERNEGEQKIPSSIENRFPVRSEVASILERACYDCHSNRTAYPWYASVQPVAWWLDDHIREGKSHLNFNTFLDYPLHRQFHKLEELEEVTGEGEMPLASYTLVHRNAILSEADKNLLIGWSRSMRDSMRVWYPEDSLKKPVTK